LNATTPILKTKEFVMKTLIAAITFASILAMPVMAKTERTRTTDVYSNESTINLERSVICGGAVLTDPDHRVRAGLQRDCGHYR
jgi:hypothetical protein